MTRPFGLVLVSALWAAVAVYGFYVVFALYGPFYVTTASFNIGYLNLLFTQDTTIRLFLGSVSLVQLLFTPSILRGGSWSFPGGLLISLVVFGIHADLYYLYATAPPRLGLVTPMLTADLYVGIGFVVLVWVYFTRPRVSRYLTRWL